MRESRRWCPDAFERPFQCPPGPHQIQEIILRRMISPQGHTLLFGWYEYLISITSVASTLICLQQHASVQHLNLTTRRCFIGPIPEGWLKSHRKSWYKEALSISNYSSKAATFSARPGVSHTKQITGLDGPSASAAFVHSFPQPEDIDEEEGENDATEESDDEGNTSEEESEDGTNEEQVKEIEAVAAVGDPDQDAPKPSSSKTKTPSFVTAKSNPRKTLGSRLKPRTVKSPPPDSFVTAKESVPPMKTNSSGALDEGNEVLTPSKSLAPKPQGSPNSPSSETQPTSSNGRLDEPNGTSSTANLLPAGAEDPGKKTSPDINITDPDLEQPETQEPQKMPTTGLVKFNLEPQAEENQEVSRARKINQVGPQRIWKRLRRGTARPGEIVKMEKMLVRVDFTQHELPEDYDENESLKVEARAIDKWQEFVVVCRESTNDESQFSLQMYKTRVIPAREEPHVRKRSTHEIPLNPRTTHVNLYSSLDKTLVIWMPWKHSQTLIYILRTRSAASAVEWYTFLRNSLGWQRSSDLMVNVPDLNVTLQVENPFIDLETSLTNAQKARADEETIQKTMEAEKAIANSIIQRSLKMLENNPEWADVLAAWLAKEKVGLAWKRYDRLEWVHGANEQRMYGTMAMQRTHELELRPKEHYPTSVNDDKQETLVEPAPVEGFLIRLTSQKGHVKRLGKMYFKRLYFAVHDQYLVYTRPAKALPPPPPKLSLNNDGEVPGAKEIVDQSPLIFAVNPYPDNNQDGEVDWIQYGSRVVKERRNREAYKEAERKINTMLKAEGYINLSHVVRVQNAQRGNSPADDRVDQGPDVDFHTEVPDTTRDDGKTTQFDDDRTFELVMKNKLVIRLQAFNPATKKEWITRLRLLVHYWHLRLAADMALFKSIRAANLSRLSIDEEQEALLGQFAKKWEVTRSVASPALFNMCPISCCRAITLSGPLYHKPRRHATFTRCSVILCHGTLLLFQHTLRTRTGLPLRHIQHPRQLRLDLSTCYIYSGLVTEDDLLAQNNNTAFDSSHPGHHALPRVYLEDGWTSTDEDTMTTFVIWQPRNKSWFRAPSEDDAGAAPDSDGGSHAPGSKGTGFGLPTSLERKGRASSKLRYVTRLGVPGRSIVFKTRSRAERDHWVMAIGMEIERVQQGDAEEGGGGEGAGGVEEEIRVVEGR